MLRQFVLSVALLATPMALLAQSHTATEPSLTPAQIAQIRHQDEDVAQAALRVAQLVDRGEVGKVWDGASSVAKQVVKRRAFVEQVTADRAQVGRLVSRKLVAITRSESRGGATPAGDYINVSFATQFANEKRPVRELISFHLDADHVWRVCGYTLR